MKILFDPQKNLINIRKHGINFVDVEAVFYDAFAITIEDVGHYEQRFLTIGMNIDHQLLVICYSYSEQDSLKIISARKADPSERRQYEEIDRF
jgi:uncharacterized DUF497 family protein